MKARRLLVILLAIVVLGGVAWTAAWHFAARKVEDMALDWITEQREAGYAVRHRALYVSGFPFRLNLEIEAPFMGSGSKLTPVDWQGGWLTLEIKPWNLHSFTVRTPGWHRFEITDPRMARAFILDAGTLDIVLRLAPDGGIGAILSEMREAEIGPEGKPERAWIAGLDLELRFPPPQADSSGEAMPAVEATVALDQFEAPETLPLALGQTVERLIAELAFVGPLPARADKESVDAWRKAGGTFEVKHFATNWGPLGVDGDGTLALDHDLQPIGAFALRLAGYEEALNALVAAEMVRPTQASAAKIVLNLIAKPDSVSGRPVASVPLTLQEGSVSVGPAILMALPRLVWD